MKTCPYKIAAIINNENIDESIKVWTLTFYELNDNIDELMKYFSLCGEKGKQRDLWLEKSGEVMKIHTLISCGGRGCGRWNNCNKGENQ